MRGSESPRGSNRGARAVEARLCGEKGLYSLRAAACYTRIMSINPSNIQLDPGQQKLLAEVASSAGKPWPEVFSEALESYCRSRGDRSRPQEDSLYDSLRRRGLIGSVKGAPPDLSTNPKHMRGFGESDHQTGAD